MRKPMVAGNWKMNGTRSSVITLVDFLKQHIKKTINIDVVVLPSFIHISQVEALLVGTPISWGAQNLYIGSQGAFTGEVAGPMLRDYGCKYVLVGHSERRLVLNENLQLVATKFKTALEFGLQPILCVGETLAERQKGQTERVIQQQLQSVIDFAGLESFRHAIIAYEPVWAIGTGQTATPQQAQDVHQFIRQLFSKQDTNLSNLLRILYGGSVKADNAASLFAMPDIDGGLVGGASLEAKGFLDIVKAAEQKKVEA